jgi:hypothetical protein
VADIDGREGGFLGCRVGVRCNGSGEGQNEGGDEVVDKHVCE